MLPTDIEAAASTKLRHQITQPLVGFKTLLWSAGDVLVVDIAGSTNTKPHISECISIKVFYFNKIVLCAGGVLMIGIKASGTTKLRTDQRL